ncbi:MAG TPA: bifunctional 2-C-methyl-D-erythritol 4-phosphate cytidylyltransferase/2-C-methyl-D-erythritol 2,4-cyclodiphosphate synthase [Terricaulis sp.]|nr:bifunctional 2-C-methyl-D-erythritol 4-phosphate cytidylyltransferase/2-C-methyl-D-erythritol 2,4-cyclodiphosphate synthase [Terricaulis sp.]
MDVAAIIVAAGRGERAGGTIPKQYSILGGRRLLLWSVEAFLRAGVEEVVVVIDAAHAELAAEALRRTPGVRTVAGGATRSESVQAGLAAVSSQIVLIHDAARPGLTPAMIAALLGALAGGAQAAAPALSIADSLRRADTGEEVAREGLMRVQTPQAFHTALIRRAYQGAQGAFTDDLSVARAAGVKPTLIPGDARLMKFTHPEDRVMLEAMLVGARSCCVGSGFDAHRFGQGDHVTLCGVRIPHEHGLLGHSDADAGWHALVDAILGALGQGDIGAHFPPSDPQWKGADSEAFLRHAAQLAQQAGARITHVDVTLICERPKIGPHREAMRARTAQVLALPLDRVSIKATTTERMGFTGRGEGLAAQATASVERPASS